MGEPNIAEKAAIALEPYILSAIERYLASEQGAARIGEFCDSFLLLLIARLKSAQAKP